MVAGLTNRQHRLPSKPGGFWDQEKGVCVQVRIHVCLCVYVCVSSALVSMHPEGSADIQGLHEHPGGCECMCIASICFCVAEGRAEVTCL